jgi:hypothetical protein
MAFTQSRSAFPVTLELYEVELLIDSHRASEYSAADEEDYQAAANNKQRREELERLLLERRKWLQAEALEAKSDPKKL